MSRISVMGAISSNTSGGSSSTSGAADEIDLVSTAGYFWDDTTPLVLESNGAQAAGVLVAFSACRRGPGDVPFALGMATLDGTSSGTIADLQFHGNVARALGGGAFLNLGFWSAIVAAPGTINLAIDNGQAENQGGDIDTYSSATGWGAGRAAVFSSDSAAVGNPTLGSIAPGEFALIYANTVAAIDASALLAAGGLTQTGSGGSSLGPDAKFCAGYAVTPGAGVAVEWSHTVSVPWCAGAVTFIPA